MSITSRKITSTTVLKGVSPSSKALPVLSNDINSIIDDLNTLDARQVVNRSASAINATATATAAQVITGYITSTSAAATAITLPTATELATALGADAGSSFKFIVDNTAGASTVTLIVGSGITVLSSPPITGTDTLTVSTTQDVALFELAFTSATAAKLIRIA